ncbi:hypothetical protein [Flindersiella endophytica]
MLRANRLYGDDERLANAKRFAAGFTGGSWPGGSTASTSQISRWETAASRAGFAVLRRYEELLGLRPASLTTVADWTYRDAVGHAGPPILDRRLSPNALRTLQRTEELLEQALSSEVMTGGWWDELTAHLAVLPSVLLYPRTAWSDLAERLLSELLISDGLRWMSRSEALARLMTHPRAGPAVVAACGSLAADPSSLIVVEPLTILDLTPAATASRHVLAQLVRPTSERTLRGALLAAVDKVSRRHFRPTQLRQLTQIALELLSADPGTSADARGLAAALLRQIPANLLGARYKRLVAAGEPMTAPILRYGRTAFPQSMRQVVERVCAAATARLPRPGVDDDPVLPHLVGQLLFDPNQNERLVAGFQIAATPYREPVGAALAAELSATHLAREIPLATAIISATPWVGGSGDRASIERFAMAVEAPAPIVEAAAWKLGHTPGSSDQRFWQTAVETHARTWRRVHDPASLTALRGLVYGLGVEHNDDLLREIRTNPRMPGSAREAAAWWLNLPAHIVTSAMR